MTFTVLGAFLTASFFQVGEDLRCDQLAVHMVSLFDRILLDSGLDLKVQRYRVLATSANCGEGKRNKKYLLLFMLLLL